MFFFLFDLHAYLLASYSFTLHEDIKNLLYESSKKFNLIYLKEISKKGWRY